jgi:hypothetical protein
MVNGGLCKTSAAALAAAGASALPFGEIPKENREMDGYILVKRVCSIQGKSIAKPIVSNLPKI